MDVQIRSQLNKGGMLAQTPQQPHTHHSQRIAGPLARWGPLKAQEREWAGSASTAVLMHCAAKTAPNVGVEEDHAGSAFAAMHCNATLFLSCFFLLLLRPTSACVRACVLYVYLHAPNIRAGTTSAAPKGDAETGHRRRKNLSCAALMRLFRQHTELLPLLPSFPWALRLTGKSNAQSLSFSKQERKKKSPDTYLVLLLQFSVIRSSLNKRPVSHRPVHGPDQTIPLSLFFARLLNRPFGFGRPCALEHKSRVGAYICFYLFQ